MTRSAKKCRSRRLVKRFTINKLRECSAKGLFPKRRRTAEKRETALFAFHSVFHKPEVLCKSPEAERWRSGSPEKSACYARVIRK